MKIRDYPIGGIALLLICCAIAAFMHVTSAVTLATRGDTLFPLDETTLLMLWFQAGYGLIVLCFQLPAVWLVFADRASLAWKLALVPVVLTIPMFMIGGFLVEVAIMGFGGAGAYRIRHEALAQGMRRASAEGD